MAMGARQSMYLILLLLAALFFGPVMVLTERRPHEPPLRANLPSERIVDAPNNLPSRSPFPEARPPARGLFPR